MKQPRPIDQEPVPDFLLLRIHAGGCGGPMRLQYSVLVDGAYSLVYRCLECRQQVIQKAS